jgi:hypothetical protein
LPAPIPLPVIQKTGLLRKSCIHYIDVHHSGKMATIHSDPFDVPLIGGNKIRDIVQESQSNNTGVSVSEAQDIVGTCDIFKRNSIAVIIPPRH